MSQKTSSRSGLYLPSLGILFVTLYPPGKANCCEVHHTIMSSLHLDYPFAVWQMPVSLRFSVKPSNFPSVKSALPLLHKTKQSFLCSQGTSYTSITMLIKLLRVPLLDWKLTGGRDQVCLLFLNRKMNGTDFFE